MPDLPWVRPMLTDRQIRRLADATNRLLAELVRTAKPPERGGQLSTDARRIVERILVLQRELELDAAAHRGGRRLDTPPDLRDIRRPHQMVQRIEMRLYVDAVMNGGDPMANPPTPALTKAEREVCEALGVSHASFAESRDADIAMASCQPPAGSGGPALTKAEREVCEALGISHASFAESRDEDIAMAAGQSPRRGPARAG